MGDLGEKERVFLFGVETSDGLWPVEQSLRELALLAQTAGLEVVGSASQKRGTIHPATYMGTGKLDELAEELRYNKVDVLITDDELSGSQQRKIETLLGKDTRVIDRTALILDIFAQHARTREGRLQVELAQNQYLLPRLAGLWTHLERQAGGAVGLRGPGETQLETDRRLIRRKITSLKRELEEVRSHRQRYRDRRHHTGVPVVAFVGYTNAGKSSLLNRLSNAGVLVANQLFATLDPTTRRIRLPGGSTVLLTDTVGFINKLPHDLVAAFRATLEEIADADIILHVVDASHPNAEGQARAALSVLDEIEAPRDRIMTVWNKIDLVTKTTESPNSHLHVSALTGQGIDEMLDAIEVVVRRGFEKVLGVLPYAEGDLLSDVKRHGFVEREDHGPEGTLVEAVVPGPLAARFRARALQVTEALGDEL